ncbi:hypothetical protein F3G63_33990, partial [Pseudomonas aeruginosa]
FGGIIPDQWREIYIFPIPKPGRDPSSASSLRPISLMSCVCKVFHLILCRRLEWFLEKNNIFSNETVGFRKSRSCLDVLSRMVSRVQIGFSRDNFTMACFLDLDNAYNNVEINALLNKLDGLGVGA